MSIIQLFLLLLLGYLLYSVGKFVMLLYRASNAARDYQQNNSRERRGSASSGQEKDITRETKVIDERWLDEEKDTEK
ncbi:MAG: hypothetical protein KDK41_01540 [Leptospiraceae bacterium]|nr:hypothetical protein [Leptospiraceae bacterium]